MNDKPGEPKKGAETGERDYSQTLFLPQTEFPMRAGLPQKEPELVAKWQQMELYKTLRASSAGREKFVLHGNNQSADNRKGVRRHLDQRGHIRADRGQCRPDPWRQL